MGDSTLQRHGLRRGEEADPHNAEILIFKVRKIIIINLHKYKNAFQ